MHVYIPGVPRLSADERFARDAFVLRLHLAGLSYRKIACHSRVRLSVHGVELALKRSLTRDRPGASTLSRQARHLYALRLESLLRSAWPKALAGDLKAAEHCRRLLEQEARLWGLAGRESGPDVQRADHAE